MPSPRARRPLANEGRTAFGFLSLSGPIHEAQRPGRGRPRPRFLAACRQRSRGRAVPTPFMNWPCLSLPSDSSSDPPGRLCWKGRPETQRDGGRRPNRWRRLRTPMRDRSSRRAISRFDSFRNSRSSARVHRAFGGARRIRILRRRVLTASRVRPKRLANSRSGTLPTSARSDFVHLRNRVSNGTRRPSPLPFPHRMGRDLPGPRPRLAPLNLAVKQRRAAILRNML